MNDEKIYMYLIYILLFFEVVMSIPLLIDSMIDKTGFEMVYAIGIMHVAMYMFGEVFRLRNHNKSTHIAGGIAFLGSFIPILAFIFHIVVVSLIFKDIRSGFLRNKKGGVEETNI